MKTSLLFFFSLLVFCSYAQIFDLDKLQTDLDRFKKPKDKLISVGFSTSEVKAKLGNPKSISGGFPENKDIIIQSMPEMAGQMNNSTWFYIYPPAEIEISYVIPQFSVNNNPTDEDIFNSYISKNEVFFVDDKLVKYDIGINYKLTKSSRLKIEPLDKSTTIQNTAESKPEKFKTKFIPVYCVIFDKGTQVVAATSAYFLAE